jgi:hypothetical protein
VYEVYASLAFGVRAMRSYLAKPPFSQSHPIPPLVRMSGVRSCRNHAFERVAIIIPCRPLQRRSSVYAPLVEAQMLLASAGGGQDQTCDFSWVGDQGKVTCL